MIQNQISTIIKFNFITFTFVLYSSIIIIISMLTTAQVGKNLQLRDYNRHRFQIELYINVWLKGSDCLFDYNSNEPENDQSFKAITFRLSVPKPEIPVYYFFHQSTIKNEQHVIYLERRKSLLSKFQLKDKQVRNFRLMGGVELLLTEKDSAFKILMRPINSCKQIVDYFHSWDQNIQTSPPYLVARTFPYGYPLSPHQILKMGKVCLRIRDIYTKDIKRYQATEDGQILDLDSLIYESRLEKNSQIKREVKRQCRICMIGEQDEQIDPLINPCHCIGSTEYVHVECIKKWISIKLELLKQTENGHTYHENQLFCQICKKRLPKIVRKNGKQFTMLSFLDKDMELIAFTPFNDQKFEPLYGPEGTLYVLTNDIKEAKVGRLQINGMILTDNSVSRQHATIKLTEEGFTIEDTKSKFGTLVYDSKAAVDLTSGMRAMQIGSCVFAFSLKQKHISFIEYSGIQ